MESQSFNEKMNKFIQFLDELNKLTPLINKTYQKVYDVWESTILLLEKTTNPKLKRILVCAGINLSGIITFPFDWVTLDTPVEEIEKIALKQQQKLKDASEGKEIIEVSFNTIISESRKVLKEIEEVFEQRKRELEESAFFTPSK